MQNIRRMRDIVSIKRSIWSNYDCFRTLPVFYLERNEVLDAVALVLQRLQQLPVPAGVAPGA